MSQFDDVDLEIDHDMGWDRGDRAGARHRNPRRSPGYWQALLGAARKTHPLFHALGVAARVIGKVVFFPLISPMGYTKRFDINGDMIVYKRSLMMRVLDGLATRLVLTPVVLALFFLGLVYLTTHPEPVLATQTPDSLGLFFRRISLTASDGQKLAAWYVPPLKPAEVVINQEEIFNQKWPAAVVCHGLGSSQDDYLPLTRQLHDAGFGVLLLDLRGQGDSGGAAVTFGIREKLDMLAGVRFLREQPNIDGGKICLVGQDMAATAALHAAVLDSSVAAVVADGLWPQFQKRVEKIFESPRVPTRWMAGLYDVTFEVALREHLDQLNPADVLRSIRHQPVLFVAYNRADFAPVKDVVELASGALGPHEVLIVDPGADAARGTREKYAPEQRITFFLANSVHWTGVKLHGPASVQKLMESKVK
jgi:pimeloyl-ACP methyl ester carboxylesterase